MRKKDFTIEKWIIDNIYTSTNKININKINKSFYEKHNLTHIYNYVENIVTTYNLSKFSEALFWIKNNITSYPLCICGKRLKFSSKYNKTCGNAVCRQKSQELTSIEKYGVSNYAKTDIHRMNQKRNQYKIKKKREKTNLEKYGVENVFQSEEIKEKIKETNLKKYDVDNPMKHKIFLEKCRISQIKKYGGMANGSKQTSLKIKHKNLEKYGVENVFQSEEIKEKIKETNLEKYNGTGFASKLIKTKIKQTSKKKYGVSLFQQRHLTNIEKWDDKDFIVKTFVFENFVNRKGFMAFFNCSLFGYYSKMKYLNIDYKKIQSYGEVEIFNSIENKTKVKADRTILDGKEIDILIPDKQLGIEFNGIYWHSELNGKDKNYHLNKTIECEKKGIQLLHIFETEWLEKQQIVMSIINSKLGLFDKRIYGRKCIVEEILPHIKNTFLEENHIQGADKSSIKLGLFYENELVSVMTFGNSRYNKKYQYEMHRFCSKLGYQIIGGASKLWKYFLRKYEPEYVITYVDRRYSNGKLYENLGFNKMGESKSNYFYFKEHSGLMSHIQFQKHKLKDKLDIFDPELTEWENMKYNGYDRIWDCGNFGFVYYKN